MSEADPEPTSDTAGLGRLRPPKVSAEDRRRIMASLDLRPSDGWVGRFALMLVLSVLVAVMGLSANSAALVIGAMLLAPLMTPVMGLAAALALAFPRRTLRMGLTVVIASVGCVLLAWLVALVLPSEPLSNEVLSRTSPDVRDLIVGLAAGTAGSFATVRPSMSSSLPGVAVAVALVPPLGAAGMALEAGRPDLGGGAILLYLANLAAIMLASVVVFLVTGLVPPRRLAQTSPHVLAGSFFAVVATVAAGIPLTIASVEAAHVAQEHEEVDRAVLDWLQGTGAALEDIEFSESGVTVRVSGANQPPPTEPLTRSIAALLGADTSVDVRWIQTIRPPETDPEPVPTPEPDRQEQLAAEVRAAVDTWLSAAGLETSLEVREVSVDGAESVRVELVGPQRPPPVEELTAVVAGILNGQPAVTVDWTETTVLVPGDGVTTDEARTKLAGALAAWAADQSVTVTGVNFDGERVVVDLLGPEPFDPSEVERVVADTLDGEVSVEVWFTQRRRLEKPTPTPEPTPTPTPTPESEPTPTPTPTP